MNPTEQGVVQFFFSDRLIHALQRCFGQDHTLPQDRRFVDYLPLGFFIDPS